MIFEKNVFFLAGTTISTTGIIVILEADNYPMEDIVDGDDILHNSTSYGEWTEICTHKAKGCSACPVNCRT